MYLALRSNIVSSTYLNLNEKLIHAKITIFKEKIILHLNPQLLIFTAGKTKVYRPFLFGENEIVEVWEPKYKKDLEEPQLGDPCE